MQRSHSKHPQETATGKQAHHLIAQRRTGHQSAQEEHPHGKARPRKPGQHAQQTQRPEEAEEPEEIVGRKERLQEEMVDEQRTRHRHQGTGRSAQFGRLLEDKAQPQVDDKENEGCSPQFSTQNAREDGRGNVANKRKQCHSIDCRHEPAHEHQGMVAPPERVALPTQTLIVLQEK